MRADDVTALWRVNEADLVMESARHQPSPRERDVPIGWAPNGFQPDYAEVEAISLLISAAALLLLIKLCVCVCVCIAVLVYRTG